MKLVVLAVPAVALALLVSCKKQETSHRGVADATVHINTLSSEYVVFAWSDTGMHMMSPAYDQVILSPPYSSLFVQVVRRGDPPRLAIGDVSVEYRILNNTFSYGKRAYGGFWDNAGVFGQPGLAHDTGLNFVDPAIHNGLSGSMLPFLDHFEADGIPVTPVDDSGAWNPFQVAEVTVKDQTGNVVATTQATIPVSDEIGCAKCHGSDPYADILAKHDAAHATDLVAHQPVLCWSCHGSPLYQYPLQAGIEFLSRAIHTAHQTTGALCLDCHPGPSGSASRTIAHTPRFDCSNRRCHGDLVTFVKTFTRNGRIPWQDEPKCTRCHGSPREEDTGPFLFRDSRGHAGLFCSSCHGAAHATVPSRTASDNFQALQYQSDPHTIGSCKPCHEGSKGQSPFAKFADEHAGPNPDNATACHVCHTSISAGTGRWPHAFQWRDR